jgi:heme A synthase
MRFSRYGRLVLIYNLAVVVWGAFVRATGSGAGCGSHWPLCNGVVVPRDPTAATIIEFTHRVTSGLALLAVTGMAVWAFRRFPKGHLARCASVAAVLFILVEALLGAGLVLLEYVEQNKSIGRAVYLSAHLTNTLLLLGAIASAAWFGSREAPRWSPGPQTRRLLWGFSAALLAGISGAVAALGDTLFPATSLAEGFSADFAGDSHVLVQLRLAHPVLAALCGLYLLWLAMQKMRGGDSRAARFLAAATVVQLSAGVVNVLLLAPVWMQLLHLALGTLVWLALTLVTLEESSR